MMKVRFLLATVSSFRETNPSIRSGTTSANDGGFRAVGFSYGNAEESIDQKNDDTESGFQPPFSVPEWLLQNLPPTEKLHQIIARTATFVSKNGGQSEIVLRVKQGDNPTFGFLMPDHHLHPYFRFLVDHQELLRSDTEEKSSGECAGGALSLLGAVYDSGEEEENEAETSPGNNKSKNAKEGSDMPSSHKSEDTASSANLGGKEEPTLKDPLSSLKEKASLIKRNHSICAVKAGSEGALKRDGEASSVSASAEKKRSSAFPNLFTAETSIMEPPFEMKRLVDKIVEFILKNGKQFESVLAEQDKDHGRFPFLRPSNQYHLYYLKVLEEAQQAKFPGKKNDASIHGAEKKSVHKDSDSLSLGSDIPDDLNKKEKFKMVIGRMKKDGQEQPPKESREELGVCVDAAAAAAILQAARRGIKNPNLEVLPRTQSLNGGQSLGSESSKPLGGPLPPATAIAETAAAVTASEADSSEAGLTKDQKLKAERLKRAKMFTSTLKSGAVPSKSPPSESVISGLGVDVEPPREREGSSVPPDSDAIERTGRWLKRSYRSRSKKQDEDDEEEEEEEEERDGDGEENTERDHKHSRKKKHKSHLSSHHSKEGHKKHRKKHSSSSSKDKDSRHQRHRHEDDIASSSDDEEYRHRRHRRRRKHRSDDDDEEDKDEHHHSKSRRRHKRDRRDRENSEEEMLAAKAGDSKRHSGADRDIYRETLVDASSSSIKASETTEVPDDLRAKIRAMLMATM
ncbi:splicing factor, suppressor of white-apricot homolog isoform X2 [Punica granatum]|uniref:Splicing factor, suppressor of white-apricot homolog isoform X2 n=1 Tax=Punica granatum TaxID=22663 RepID=A0A6P8EH14_PUNGR|nr:splicing factor, suppressor of white-apricot homolog isoform X2 [Punica granatum]